MIKQRLDKYPNCVLQEACSTDSRWCIAPVLEVKVEDDVRFKLNMLHLRRLISSEIMLPVHLKNRGPGFPTTPNDFDFTTRTIAAILLSGIQ